MHEYITNAEPSKPAPGLEGAILAGGKSRRMGWEKLLLPFGEGTVLDAISAALSPLVERVRLIGRAPAAGLPTSQPDVHPGLGPLSGIHAALATSKREAVLVVACDMPFVTTAFLQGLVRALTAEDDAVMPSPGGEPVPVCALYRVRCLEAAARRLERGDLAARDFARSIKCRFLGDREIARIDPGGRALLNLNTPADYEKALDILRNESKT